MKRLKLAALVAAIGCASSLQAAETYTLKFGHFLPSTSYQHTQMFEPWCAKLKDESAGRLQCQIYPSMQLGGTPAKLADMVRNGVADIVWTAPSYSPGKFPRIEVLEQPFLMPYGSRNSDPIIWNFYQQYAKDDFKGYKVLSMHGDGGMGFHTRSKAVTSLDDLKGMKLRASNRASSLLVESLGAAPVSMPPPQMTESLSKGVIDGVLFTWSTIRDVKIDEVTRYHSASPEGAPALSNTVLTMLMNPKKFDSLPKDLQEIIERNSGDALNDLISGVWDQQMDASIKATPAEQIVPISADNYAAMQKAAEPVAQNWVKEVSAKGIDGAALLQGARDLATAQAQNR
ncbi:TRAP transporter substrate-binding protein [Pseudomonas sp. NW5]|uniref:TRAP transporter substrate-binding protein n=1 Tax=Pseudomonas sp. NW5 TaxID=2934934 RepID=UPI0020203B5F|nr:TRAP transporter substrate-binding protein [Pseudomonas sp. NW5]MCL7462135.1 TRAP transporter substrate-binding protein [Pseudomonas sp. NW5]